LEDLGLEEKGIVKVLAPALIRRLTLCFSIVSINSYPGSYIFMVVPGAWIGGPDFPGKWSKFPEEASSGNTPFLKWSASLH
jgi:hypothetical protein